MERSEIRDNSASGGTFPDYAEPVVIGRAFARPVGSIQATDRHCGNTDGTLTRHAKRDCFVACACRNDESNVTRTNH
jgi:hypothetical protein